MRGRSTIILVLLMFAVFTALYILFGGQNILLRLNGSLQQRSECKCPGTQSQNYVYHSTVAPEKPKTDQVAKKAIAARQADVRIVTQKPTPYRRIPRKLTKVEEYQQRYPDPHNDTVVLPSKEEMEKMDQTALGNLYHRYVNSLQIFCRKVVRLGKLDDGGWDFCDDYRFRPRNNCLVYSYGIQFDFSFDDAMVKNYNCEVHSFDPSMRVGDHKHGHKVFFHATGLSSDNNPSRNNWKMRTLQRQREELGHSKRPIDVLKIDIEEYEYLALPNMIATGAIKDVRQMAIEFHVTLKSGRNGNMKQEPDKRKYFFALSLFKDVYDMGFRIFWTHRNPTCKFFSRVGYHERVTCHEISFVNINNM